MYFLDFDLMKRYILFVFIAFILVSCGKKQSKQVITKTQYVAKTKEGITILPIFQDNTKTRNNLSEIAKKVHFVALDNKVPITAFHTIDIALSNEYIFLMSMYKVMQFDKSGKFIRYIGKRGQGPREFLQLTGNLQLDEDNQLVYLLDTKGLKIQVYDFKGEYQRTIKIKMFDDSVTLIDSTTLLIQSDSGYRFLHKKIPFLRIANAANGALIHEFKSRLYPLNKNKREVYGVPTSCFQWNYNNSFYCLEYGCDTVYKIDKPKRVPAYILTGDSKLEFKDLYKKRIGDKLKITGEIMHQKVSVFEIEKFIIVRLMNSSKCFFSLYNKQDNKVYCTNHNESSRRHFDSRMKYFRSDYFIDDLVSGLKFNPFCQSKQKMISLINAETICEQRDKIFAYTRQHSSKEGNLLKSIIANLSEDDNPVVMLVE